MANKDPYRFEKRPSVSAMRLGVAALFVSGCLCGCGVSGSDGIAKSSPVVDSPETQFILVRPTCPIPTNLPVEDLGTFGGTISEATDINEHGQVTGSATIPNGDHLAFRYAGTLQQLPEISNFGPTYGLGINNTRQIAAQTHISGGQYDVVRVTPGQGSADVAGPGYASDINSSGTVVGFKQVWVNGQSESRIGRFLPGGTWEDLGTLGGPRAQPTAISDDGTIVGSSYLSTTPANPPWYQAGHAFVWNAKAGLQDLNTFVDPNAGWELTQAADISPDGAFIVGQGIIGGQVRSFRYHNGIIDNLGRTEGGGFSYARGVNNRGDVVGVAYLDGSGVGNIRATIFTADLGLVNLNHTISPSSGWLLTDARRINHKREVVGWGIRDGSKRAFRMQLPLPCGAYGQALLVVANAASVQDQDARIRDRLVHLGFSVTLQTAASSQATQAAGKTLVVISESVAPSDVAAKFKSVIVPVILSEPGILDDMGMAGAAWGSQQGSDGGLTSLQIADPTSPLAAGLSGNVTLATSASTWIWAKPGAQAKVIARRIDDPTKAALFTYEPGATLFDGTVAAAPRAAFFAGNNSTPALNTEGWRLFDALVLWATQKQNSHCALPCAPSQACVNGPAGPACMHLTAGTASCTRANDGTLRCWGDGNDGALGLNANYVGATDRPESHSDVPLGASALAVASGGHTCVLLEGGAVKCFGKNGFGQLGYGHTEAVGRNPSPAAIAAINLGEPALRIATGYEHTCVQGTSKRVFCFGRNHLGQLGLGNNTSPFDAVADQPAEAQLANFAVQLPELVQLVDLQAGGNATCAVLVDGKVRCWGAMQVAGQNGTHGHLGDNEQPHVAPPITLAGPARSVTVGLYHACAVLNDGGVTCWGSNNYGQLGTGTAAGLGYGGDSLAMPPPVLRFESPVREVVAGAFHTCARLDSGKVQCWGDNAFGQLGAGHTQRIGDNEPATAAAPLTFAAPVVQLASAIHHSCALLANGAVQCWGNGAGGVLGHGNQNNVGDNEVAASVQPVAVGGSLPSVDNWLNDGGFEAGLGNWQPIFPGPQGIVQLSHETSDARGSLGAMRVKINEFDRTTHPLEHSAGGAALLNRVVAPGEYLEISFWAKQISAPPGARLMFNQGRTTLRMDPLVTLSNEWRFYRVGLFNTHMAYQHLHVGLHREDYEATWGEFLIDDIVVRRAPRCQDVVGGNIRGRIDCRIDSAPYASEEVTVSFEARAPYGPVNLAPVSWQGRYRNEGFTVLDHQWKTVTFNLPLRHAQHPFSLRAAATEDARHRIEGIDKVFEVRGFSVQETQPCEPNDPTNLLRRSTFACDHSGVHGWLWDRATREERGGLITIRHRTDLGGTQDGTGAVSVEIPVFPPGVETYTHNYGAMLEFRESLALGSWVRVAFDAKRVNTMESPYLRLNRPYGGITGANTVTLKDNWEHFELTAQEQYGSGSFIMQLLPSKDADFISNPVQGAFALDNVRVERLPTCDGSLDLTRDGLLTCMLPPGFSSGQRLRVHFNAQSLSGSPRIHLTRPWAQDAGNSEVALGATMAPQESGFVVFNPNEPLTFRVLDSNGGLEHQEPGKGRFRIANISFEPVTPCDNNAGLPPSLVVNSGFECDLHGWSVGRWDVNSNSYVNGGLSHRLLPPEGGRSQAMRVIVGPPDPGVLTNAHHPAGARMKFNDWPSNRWVRLRFDARRADPQGSQILHVNPRARGETAVRLADEWRSYTVTVIRPYAMGDLFFMLSDQMYPGAPATMGTFDLDNVVMEEAEDCTQPPAGAQVSEWTCNIPPAYIGNMAYKVTYEARSVEGVHDVSVTLPQGVPLGGAIDELTPEWRSFTTHVRFRSVNESQEGMLSFRVLDTAGINGSLPRGHAALQVRNVQFAAPTCLGQEKGVLAMNSGMECDSGWWYPFVHDHGKTNSDGTPAMRSDLLRVEWSSHSATSGTAGAIKVTQLPDLMTIPNHTHGVGAIMILRENTSPADRLRISYDAKLPAGATTSPYLRFGRPWGGMSAPTTVRLTENWQHFEHTFTETYGAGGYKFVLQATDTQEDISPTAVGSFLIDNVILERVVSCGAAGSEGKACDDGNACTTGDRCVAGACVAAPKTCDDGDACTEDACSNIGLCTHTPSPTGAACCAGVVSGERLLTSTTTPAVYQQTWETCGNAMEGEGGSDARYEQDQRWQQCVPAAGGQIVALGEAAVTSSWFDAISTRGGGTFCLSAAIRWGSGGRPYVSVVRLDAGASPIETHRLIGGNEPDGLGGNQIPVLPGAPPWRYYRRSFIVPPDTHELRIQTGTDASVSQQADWTSAIDDVQLIRGACP